MPRPITATSTTKKKVARLKNIFATETFDRTDPQNFIVEEISKEVLLIVVESSGLALERLRHGSSHKMH